MVNVSLISAIIFYALVILFFLKTKKRWDIQGKIVALYKTKLGLKFMDALAGRYPRIMRVLGYIGVALGFIGMAFIFVTLIKSTIDLFFKSGVVGIAPVLPGIRIPGLPVLSFWHWLIGIFVLALVHEFAHGVLARTHGIKVKSSGFGFLGPIMLAFVEPDEKKMNKKSKMAQMSVMAAGPFSNMIFAAIFMVLFLLVAAPLTAATFDITGMQVNAFTEGLPAEISGLELPFVVTAINGIEVKNTTNFIKATETIKPGTITILETDQGEFKIPTVESEENKTKGLIGMNNFELKKEIKEGTSPFAAHSAEWITLLLYWLFLLNLGVGLFNLLPLGPFDGGRMFFLAALAIFKNEKKAKKYWAIISYIIILLIIINLAPWLSKLVRFVSGF